MKTKTNNTDSASIMPDNKNYNNASNSGYQVNLHNQLAGITAEEMTDAFDRINAIYQTEGGAAVEADRLRVAQKFPAFKAMMMLEDEQVTTDRVLLEMALGYGFGAHWLASVAENRLSRNLEHALLNINPAIMGIMTDVNPDVSIAIIFQKCVGLYRNEYAMFEAMDSAPLVREMLEGHFVGAPAWKNMNLEKVKYCISIFAASLLNLAESRLPNKKSIALRHNFGIVLADEESVFDSVGRSVIDSYSHMKLLPMMPPEYCNLPCLLPQAHLRREATTNGGTVSTEIIDISRAGMDAIQACCLVKPFDIAAKLVPITKSIARPHALTNLFAQLLDDADAIFLNNFVLFELEQVFPFDGLPHDALFSLFTTLEEAKEICCAIPDKHIRRYDLFDVVNDVHLARVVKISIIATVLVIAWLRCNRSLDVDTLHRFIIDEFGYHHEART